MILQDLRFGLRLLWRSPAFAIAAILTLALGIGATTAVFSIAHAVIIRRLQFPESDRVMTVLQSTDNKAYRPMDSLYAEWRSRQQSFDTFAAALAFTTILRDGEGAREIPDGMVNGDFFPIIGARPVLGRLFTREDERQGSDNVAVLDNGFWQREFSASPTVLGRSINIKDRQFTIVGVLPPGVHFPTFGTRDVWIPLASDREQSCGGYGGTLVLGRLREGVSREAAQSNMDAVNEQVRTANPCFRRVTGAVVVPLREWLAGDVRTTILMLAGAAVFLLLIACANLANLLLTRATGRRREMAIRAAIGAGRWRLAVQMLTESLLLTTLGGAAGIGLAAAAVRVAPAIRAIDIPRLEEVGVDRNFLLIGFGVSLLSGLLFGLAPAISAWHRDPILGLQRGAVRASNLVGRSFRNFLVAAQVALVLVLLSGAGLMTNTVFRLLSIDLGFSRSHVFKIQPSFTAKMRDRSTAAQYLRELRERVAAMPGVETASVANAAPFTLSAGGYTLRYIRDGALHEVETLGRDVDPGYFRTLGVPLIAGRDFEPEDASRKPVPLILNQSATRAVFGNLDPIGKIVECTDKRVGPMQVVGIVGDARVMGASHPPGPQAFALLMGGWGYASTVLARFAVPPAALAVSIRSAVSQLDPGSAPPKIDALDDLFAEQLAEPRFYMLLLDGFGLVGLVLAATGVYGVIAYAVAQRTHEFGVRLALGAMPGEIVRMVVSSGARVVVAGAVAGLAGALAVTRFLSSLLFEIKANDPWTLATISALLIAVALAACWVAARRASSVELSVALRQE